MSFNARIERIELDQNQIKDYKKLTPEDPKVLDLLLSIQDVGLLEPIIISKDYQLINGKKRIYVFHEIFNRKTIPADHPQNKDIKDTDLEIAKIDTTLIGPDPDFWEIGKLAHNRQKLFESKYPELASTTSAGRRSKQLKGIQTPLEEIVNLTGISRTSVNENKRIYQSFNEEQAEYLKDNSFNKTQALKMCSWPIPYRNLFLDKLMDKHSELPPPIEKLTRKEKNSLLEKADSIIDNIHESTRMKQFKERESSAKITKEITSFEYTIKSISKKEDKKIAQVKPTRYQEEDNLPIVSSGVGEEGALGKILSGTVESGYSILGLQEIRNGEGNYAFFRMIGQFVEPGEALFRHLEKIHNTHVNNKDFRGVWLVRNTDKDNQYLIVRESSEQKINLKQMKSIVTLRSSIEPFISL